jgi:hypothetical protein
MVLSAAPLLFDYPYALRTLIVGPVLRFRVMPLMLSPQSSSPKRACDVARDALNKGKNR